MHSGGQEKAGVRGKFDLLREYKVISYTEVGSVRDATRIKKLLDFLAVLIYNYIVKVM